MHDHDDLTEAQAIEIAALVDGLRFYTRTQALTLSDTHAGRWVADDLVYRIGTQLPDMEDSHVEELKAGGSPMSEAQARRTSNLCAAFAARIKEMAECP
jgi:hypothetical protein